MLDPALLCCFWQCCLKTIDNQTVSFRQFLKPFRYILQHFATSRLQFFLLKQIITDYVGWVI